MQNLNPYLTFNGNCKEAMTFYHQCLGGNLEIMPFGDSGIEVPDEAKDKTMHAVLTIDSIILMASDTMPGQNITFGSNMSLSINCSSREEVDKLYASLGEGGIQTMPLQDTFWGAYFGMLDDKFGVQWMFNYDTPTS